MTFSLWFPAGQLGSWENNSQTSSDCIPGVDFLGGVGFPYIGTPWGRGRLSVQGGEVTPQKHYITSLE